MNKLVGNLLKGGATAVGIGAMFTPVGAIAGLSGGAAFAADLVGGGILSHFVDKGVDKFKKGVDKETSKDGDTKKSSKKDKNDSEAQQKEIQSAEAKDDAKQERLAAANSDNNNDLFSSLGINSTTNSNGRSTGSTLMKFNNDKNSLLQNSQKNYVNQLQSQGAISNDYGSAEQQADM